MINKYFHSDKEVQSGVPFELNGLAYPWNWFDLASDEDLLNHGFTKIVEPAPAPIAETLETKLAKLGLTVEDIKQAVEVTSVQIK